MRLQKIAPNRLVSDPRFEYVSIIFSIISSVGAVFGYLFNVNCPPSVVIKLISLPTARFVFIAIANFLIVFAASFDDSATSKIKLSVPLNFPVISTISIFVGIIEDFSPLR